MQPYAKGGSFLHESLARQYAMLPHLLSVTVYGRNDCLYVCPTVVCPCEREGKEDWIVGLCRQWSLLPFGSLS